MINKIREYLTYGFVPGSYKANPHTIEIEKTTKSYNTESAYNILSSIFDNHLRGNGIHLVPLSGGYDSRLILAELVKRLNTDEIETISFGANGQLDYEIAKNVSTYYGVKHHTINLNDLKIQWKDILESTKTSPWTYVPDGLINSLTRNYSKSMATSVWIGFLGDPLTGGHYQSQGEETITNDEIVKFLSSQVRSRYFRDILPKNQNQFEELNDIKTSPFKAHEYLDFCIRQKYCIAPIVLGRVWNDWEVIQGEENDRIIMSPFCDKRWAQYWLNVPRKYHKGQYLYKNLLYEKHPDVMQIPVKDNYGIMDERKVLKAVTKYKFLIKNKLSYKFSHIFSKPSLMENYLNFEQAFRNRDDYKKVAYISFNILKEYDVFEFSELNKIWSDHQNYKANHAQELLLLIGLAANLKVQQ